MSIFDTLLQIIAPHVCLVCEVEGALLCSDCSQKLKPAPSACYRCERTTVDFETCQDCIMTSPLSRVTAAADYSGTAKQLIWKLKSGGAQAAAEIMASRMRQAFVGRTSAIIVPIPTASSRVRSRGYDQAHLLANELSRHLRLPCKTLLIRRGQAHQVGASRLQRLSQLESAFRVSKPHQARLQHIILVDDVVTTGASLEMAAGQLKRAGAVKVEAITFARAGLRQDREG